MLGTKPAAKCTSTMLLTGDAGKITVGNNTSIQDGAIIRTAAASALDHETMHATHDTVIGNNVTVGHQVDTHSKHRLPQPDMLPAHGTASSDCGYSVTCSALTTLHLRLCRSACMQQQWRTMHSSALAPYCWRAQRQANSHPLLTLCTERQVLSTSLLRHCLHP
jgi:hypothetical protein